MYHEKSVLLSLLQKLFLFVSWFPTLNLAGQKIPLKIRLFYLKKHIIQSSFCCSWSRWEQWVVLTIFLPADESYWFWLHPQWVDELCYAFINCLCIFVTLKTVIPWLVKHVKCSYRTDNYFAMVCVAAETNSDCEEKYPNFGKKAG